MSQKKPVLPDYESVTPFLKGQASKIFKEVADNDKVLIVQKQNKPQKCFLKHKTLEETANICMPTISSTSKKAERSL